MSSVEIMELHPKLVILLTALGIAIVFIRRVLVRRQLACRHGCQPVARSFSKDPFLGLDVIFETIRAVRQHQILKKNCELFRAYGNTFRVRELHRSAIVTIEPENIKTILSLKFTDYSISHRLEPFKPLLGESIFNTDGEHWASSRALIRPSFVREQVADLSMLEDLMQDLFVLLPRDGTTVDLQELFFRYTIDSATEFLFGRSVGTLKRSHSDVAFAAALHYAQRAVLKRGMLGWLNAIYCDRKADECNRICRNFVQQFVEEAVYAAGRRNENKESGTTETKRKYILSHELASRTSDKQRILDELMSVLLAGRDTTAGLLGNLFFMLAKNPLIWEKLRVEVDVLQNRPPTYEELRRLKYVQCCVNESLRLHPVVPRNQREAIRDTVLPLGGGEDGLSPVFVPKGTLVSYNIYAMHRRTDFYGSDAEKFRPERWEEGKLQPRWEYLPFNGGPRICLGQRYALTEASYVLVRMVQEFRMLESRDPGPWEESLALTLCSRNGARVGLIP
ncbi:cytochrome P450 [Aspergillus bertholletiae]|uniref:Cytochrome P450 n=1 Tax=Aspergillus bertholletiae TaxID=1226010 RepID=A0A5N7BEY5_9EURO|nr:cytochrome P450 [Aspergillus bertholletiae]